MNNLFSKGCKWRKQCSLEYSCCNIFKKQSQVLPSWPLFVEDHMLTKYTTWLKVVEKCKNGHWLNFISMLHIMVASYLSVSHSSCFISFSESAVWFHILLYPSCWVLKSAYFTGEGWTTMGNRYIHGWLWSGGWYDFWSTL